MKIKLKSGAALSNNWKSCGCTKEDWDNLKAGDSIEGDSVPSLIKDNIDVVEPTSKNKKTGGK